MLFPNVPHHPPSGTFFAGPTNPNCNSKLDDFANGEEPEFATLLAGLRCKINLPEQEAEWWKDYLLSLFAAYIGHRCRLNPLQIANLREKAFRAHDLQCTTEPYPIGNETCVYVQGLKGWKQSPGLGLHGDTRFHGVITAMRNAGYLSGNSQLDFRVHCGRCVLCGGLPVTVPFIISVRLSIATHTFDSRFTGRVGRSIEMLRGGGGSRARTAGILFKWWTGMAATSQRL